MRLLREHCDNWGGITFGLAEFHSNNPRYVIFSHTWGADDQEVTFKDIVENSIAARNKAGYAKLLFCAKQAADHGLRYFWIDTCCIDKSSSAELSEAINSMFRSYKNAAACFVFLADVSSYDFRVDNRCFEKSRWFTRGWTLQELVAPERIEFYTKDAERIGTRDDLLPHIVEATGISTEAVQGCPLGYFSVR
ncbi:HET-domain-containing protein [Bimuria novae-zelandiae CBS 107.79]|uniref:HET-domain-containing protein n=1 Tax=Bimuria novae-zelandiae CBS 107.79 TaxID=1447943 RepID=A0A6A5UT85_9PLEO|nr:HET-domain-containing protein [Bimuria novae-zelandiae CBS 107.79]